MHLPSMGPDPVASVLRSRGFFIDSTGNNREILVPLDSDAPLSGEIINEFRRLFGHASFRKSIRRITANGGTATIDQLEAISGDRAEEYVDFLVELGVAVRTNDAVTLTRPIDNIGKTLEWYAADLCKRDLNGSAEWSVKLPEFPYGDCDVIAWLPPTLLSIEIKSSPPSEVTDSELKHFLQRGIDFAPDLAVLLIDTDDDLVEAGLIERLFELMIPTLRLSSGIDDLDWRHDNVPFIAPQPRFPGVYFGYHRFYVTNSEPSILTQLSRCLRHYHTKVKGVPFYQGLPVNFVTGSLESD